MIEAEPGAGWAYTDAWALDERTGPHPARDGDVRLPTAGQAARRPVRGDEAADPQNFMWVSATVRRQALEQVGAFNESMKSAEDIELWFRILAKGWKVVRMPGVLGVKRERPGAMSERTSRTCVT